MGELELQALRIKAEAELKELFDLREFHYTILEAYGPMKTVKKEVERWIQIKLGN